MNVKTIIGIFVSILLIGGVAAGVWLTQQQTQLKSQAAGGGSITVNKTTINKSGGQWESIPITVNIDVAGADGSKKIAAIFVRLVPSDPSSGAGWSEIFSYATNGSGVVENFSPTSNYQAGVYEFGLFLMDGNNAIDLINKSAAVNFQDSGSGGSSGGGGSTDTGGSTAAGSISVGTASINKVNGNWAPVPLTVITNVPGANNSKTIAGVYVRPTSAPANQGWVAIDKFYGTNQTDNFNWAPPLTYYPGAYQFGLFLMDNSTVVDSLGTSATVTFVDSGSGGIGIVEAGECQSVIFKKDGQTVNTSLTVGQTYNVEITMKNYDKNTTSYSGPTWVIGQYFLGYPTNGSGGTNRDTGPGNFQTNTTHSGVWGINWPDSLKLRLPLTGNIAPNGQQVFNFTATPNTVGTHSFYWGMVHENVTWFGGQCASTVSVQAAASGGPTTTTPPSAGPTASSSATPATIIEYRLAQGVTDFQAKANLNNAPIKAYLPSDATGSMVIQDIILDNIQPGDVRYIAVQFRKGGGAFTNAAVSKLVKYVGNSPAISGVVCRFPATGTGTLVEISGSNFGSAGTVRSSNKTIDQVESFSNEKVIVRLKDKSEDKIKIKVVTAAGIETVETECQVNTSTLDFQLTNSCGASYSANDVEVNIYDSSQETQGAKPFLTQKFNVKNGKPQSFTPKLEQGKDYTLIVKAPKTVARKVNFKSGSGTTVIDKTIVLPVGDISPVDDPDGKINANDHRELIRQWNILTNVTRTGDFNGDNRVNSIDYSCFRLNNTKEDDVYAKVVSASSNPVPSSSPTTRNLQVRGSVFFDQNANRTLDSGEQMVSGVTVKVLRPAPPETPGALLTSAEFARATLLAQAVANNEGFYSTSFTAPSSILNLVLWVDPSSTTGLGGQGTIGIGAFLDSFGPVTVNVPLTPSP